MPNPAPPATRTIYADQVRAGHAARMVQQPNEILDYAVDFTKLLPTGYTNFAMSTVTYGIGVQGAAAVAGTGIAYVYVDTSSSATAGTDGVITVKVSYKDPAATSEVLIAEFTIAVRDQ